MATTQALTAVLRRELKRFIRRRDELLQPLVFFLLVVTLVSIAVGPDQSFFARLAPAIAWVAVILALTLKLDVLFEQDYLDGTLEQLSLSTTALPILVGMKLFAHWLVVAVPQIIAALFFMTIIGADASVTLALGSALVLGTPTLLAIGAIASSSHMSSINIQLLACTAISHENASTGCA